MNITIFSARVTSRETNTFYPVRHDISSPDALHAAVLTDHVCAEYKGNRRSAETFIRSNCVFMDVDNDHSNDPAGWITPEALASEFSDIAYAITYSRHHMLPKDSYSPRPRFHVYFQIKPVTDAARYKTLKEAIQAVYPFFDGNALDAARFVYGSEPGAIVWHDGPKTIESLLTIDPPIREGNRNRTMFQWALRALKRYGQTEDTRRSFYEEAAHCSPPLPDMELDAIWRSASKYYEKIKADPAYISPEEYNGSPPSKWEPPIPFGKHAMAAFPVDALPKDIADYVRAVAECTQTPVDFPGTVALAILSVCLQKKYRIMGKRNWIEPLNLYVIIIAKPSERKSAVDHLMLIPINEYETRFNQINAAHFEYSRMQKRVLERRQKSIEELVAKGKADPSEMDRVAQEVADCVVEQPLQLYVDDITPEKLVSVLSANHGHAAIISSEGGIFDTLAGIYSRNVNIDVMLKGFSGDTIRVDRINRESESIIDPALTVLLMAQPNVVSSVLGNQTFRGRGLTARFLYSMPVSIVGSRRYDSESIPDEVAERYERKIFNLLEDDYPAHPETITLSQEADAMLKAFAESLEPKLITVYADMADWAGKLVGYILRIAGLLCRANPHRGHEFLEMPEPLVVDDQTMANAIRLGEYFLNHAQAAYDVLPEDGTYKRATLILETVLNKGMSSFDRRQLMRACRSFKTVDEIQPVLDFLDDYGYIVEVPQKAIGCGRPPLPKYLVNPRCSEVFRPSGPFSSAHP